METRKFFLNWPRLLGHFLYFSSRFVKVKFVSYPNLKEVGPVIITTWHSNDIAALPHYKNSGKYKILISHSQDGEILAQALKAMNFDVCRGSSSKGGVDALIEMRRSLEKEQYNIVFAADGPRGPRYIAKPGAAYIAAKTGRPIYSLGVASTCNLAFNKTWHKTYLPLPGSKLLMYFAGPLNVPKKATKWPSFKLSRIVNENLIKANHIAQIELKKWQKK